MKAESSAGSSATPETTSPSAPTRSSDARSAALKLAPVDAPNSASSTKADPHPTNEASTPHCSVDADCRGPRTADCIQATCEAGTCQNDESKCGCSTHADCKDDNPCTRDHCFARTQKCVFIPIDGCR